MVTKRAGVEKKGASILHQIWHVLSPGWQGDKMCRNRDSSGNSQTTDCILDSVSYREIHVSSPVIPCLFLTVSDELLQHEFAPLNSTCSLFVCQRSILHIVFSNNDDTSTDCRSEPRQSWISRVVTLGSTPINVFAASMFVSVSVRHAGLCRTCGPAFWTCALRRRKRSVE